VTKTVLASYPTKNRLQQAFDQHDENHFLEALGLGFGYTSYFPFFYFKKNGVISLLGL
jgi:hypothetical protein